MSATLKPAIANPDRNGPTEALSQDQPVRSAAHQNYKGFVAGVFSGIAKLSGNICQIHIFSSSCAYALSVGHPFDTVKVRLQTSDKSQFRGPLHCVARTIGNEGIRGLYKGATPPLVGWMFMDSM